VQFEFNTYWIYKHLIMTQLQTGQASMMSDNIEEVKEMLFDTNPYFLGLTMAVSVLHMFFEFLAFKNGTTVSLDRSQTFPTGRT